MSYHPQRVFGKQENERKGEKMREIGERREPAETFSPKSFLNQEDICYSEAWEYIVSQLCKITKTYELATVT